MSRPRYLAPYIENDLTKKTILLSGPRQVGKTTLSMNLKEKTEYLNFDNSEDRLRILKAQWDRSKELLVLDELHKMYRWKQWLKGIYDKEKLKIPILAH